MKISLLMECSRVFALPTSIFSWLVIFIYSIIESGNILYGIIALFGICFAHLGTNLLDDYFDYKSLIKQVGFDKDEYIKQSQKTKCRYIINGSVTPNKVFLIAGIYFFLALICGIYLYFKCGIGVLFFTLAGAIIAVLYPFISKFCLSEVAVSLAYGPILFGGVYYVMTGTYSWETYLLALPTMFVTVILLYVHTVMDYDFDLNEGKKTIANRFDSQLDSLKILKFLIIMAYLSLILLCIFDILDWQVFFVFLTLPLAIDLYKSMVDYTTNQELVPERKWFHFPMENLNILKEQNNASFMVRIYQSRNLMIYFSLFFVIAIIISKAL